MNTCNWNNKPNLHLRIYPQTTSQPKEKRTGNEENISPITNIAHGVLSKPSSDVKPLKSLSLNKPVPSRPAPPRPNKVLTNVGKLRIPLPTRKPPAKPTVSQELALPSEAVTKKKRRVEFDLNLNEIRFYDVEKEPELEQMPVFIRTATPLPQVPPPSAPFVPRYLSDQSHPIVPKGTLEMHRAKKP